MAAYPKLNCCLFDIIGRFGTLWNLDRDFTAGFLGFKKKVKHFFHNKDVHWVVNTVAAISCIMFNLRNFTSNFQLWPGSKYGYAIFSQEHFSGSSIFLYKRNLVIINTVKHYIFHVINKYTTTHSGCTSMGTGNHLICAVPLLEDWIAITTKAIGSIAKIVFAITLKKRRIKDILDENWTKNTNLVNTFTYKEMFSKN